MCRKSTRLQEPLTLAPLFLMYRHTSSLPTAVGQAATGSLVGFSFPTFSLLPCELAGCSHSQFTDEETKAWS